MERDDEGRSEWSDGSDTFKLVEREKSDRCSEGERTRVIRSDVLGVQRQTGDDTCSFHCTSSPVRTRQNQRGNKERKRERGRWRDEIQARGEEKQAVTHGSSRVFSPSSTC